MKTDLPPSEPSMDEILASIRQIISSNACKDPERDEEDEEDILDLTHALPEENLSETFFDRAEERMILIDGKKSPFQKPAPSPLEDLLGPLEDEITSKVTAQFEDPLLSQKAVKETVQAFSSLNKVSSHRAPSLDERITGQTIESLVREMLKPLLKEWLDENLPMLVRWVVAEQVEKILQQRNSFNLNQDA